VGTSGGRVGAWYEAEVEAQLLEEEGGGEGGNPRH
jgi:hypothetical protein